MNTDVINLHTELIELFCTQCGTTLKATANFCKKCGAPVRKKATNLRNRNFNESMTVLFQKAKIKLVSATAPKIETFRTKTVNRIESAVQDLNDPDKPHTLSDTQREKLAQSLNTLRTKIITESLDGEPTNEEAQKIVEITEELMNQVRNDKCPICLKSLNPNALDTNSSSEVSICPNCGHGGHQNHFVPWIKEKQTCPFCKISIKPNQLLELSLS